MDISHLYEPSLIPNQMKERLIEDDNLKKNNPLEEKSEEEINDIINTSNGYFERVLKFEFQEDDLIEMYLFLIENIQYASIPCSDSQSIIEQQAIDIQNIKIAKASMQYISYFARDDSELENRILSNLDVSLLHQYFSPETEITEELFQFLNTFLCFTPNTVYFCLEFGIYNDLLQSDAIENEDQLKYKFLLIKTAVITFNSIEDNYELYEKVIDYLSYKLEYVSLGVDNKELVCYCISHCILKKPEEYSKYIFKGICLDMILAYWESDIKNFNEKTISINFNISFIIFMVCWYNPDRMNTKYIFARWIRSRFIFSNLINRDENELEKRIEFDVVDDEIDEDEIMARFQNKIDNINVYLIEALISLIQQNSFSVCHLFLPLDSNCNTENKLDFSFLEYMLDLLIDGNCKMKSASVQFFWTFCHIGNERTNSNYIYRFLEDHNVIEKSIEYFEQLDGLTLKESLKEILKMINSIGQDFNDHPIINQIRTEDNFQVFQRISLDNVDEEIRDLAVLILRQVF